MERRSLLLSAASLLGLAACGPKPAQAQARAPQPPSPTEAAFKDSPYRKISSQEWLRRLGERSYLIMRQEDTEIAGTGPFLSEKRKGTFLCRGCDLPLFKSEWKYESGTGWPSFFDAIKTNIGTKVDRSDPREVRTEYHCAQCLGHHGHIFTDGPRPTGLRYCNNGYALKFVPA